jgi:tRNA dimethylallyltransferase
MSAPASQDRVRVVVVAGPTAAGKTALAIEWAEQWGGEIVGADSQQVYRYMDVGTAKPTAEERLRVIHHLIDVADPDEAYSAGRYEEEAAAAVDAIVGRGRVPFVVGGTGLYLRALLDGLTTKVGRDPERRAALEAEQEAAKAAGDTDRLHRRLAKVDAVTAERLHPNDAVRIIRALEVTELTGRPASESFRDAPAEPRYDALQLVIDPGRDLLNERIDRRCEAMVNGGLLQEVRNLREMGYGPELASMRAIGYRHLQPVVDGVEILANVVEQLQHDTRQFARRQRTWFRAVEGAVWIDPERERKDAGERIARFLETSP